MIVYGYVKNYQYNGDGTMMIQVRIPSIHGAFLLDDYKGKRVRNYTLDENLPYYPSLLLPHTPLEGEVVALTNLNKDNTQFIVLGLTGGSYYTGATNIGG